MKKKFSPFLLRNLFLLFLILLVKFSVTGAHLENIPTIVVNPDGTEIHCFSSGDEFFSYIHDRDGYTIIQGKDGYYYYGLTDGDLVVPSKFRVIDGFPKSSELKPNALISESEYKRRVDAFWSGVPKGASKAPHTGSMNNIVIYIRFSDDTEFTEPRSTYDNRLNKPDGPSMKHYFQEVSYNQLTIDSYHYPIAELTTNLSYQDSEPRSYYQPYNASTNTNGYQGDTQRRIREHTLLQRAVEAVRGEIPESLIIDADSDGLVDNVCFIIRGNAEGWNDLLWAHRWVLYTYDVRIHGKRVYDYTFQPENQTDTRVLAHEMFHTLGAPDLYRYYNDTWYNPVGPWDLMSSGFVHMGAHMKLKYANGNWISSIPTISTPDVYTLNPLTSSTNNAFRVNSPNSSSEYFVLEYRKKDGLYESSLPYSGLLIYRIQSGVNGNASGPPDEVYIYRPGGSTTQNGNINNAVFSANSGRTEINDETDPSPFLSNGNPGGLDINNITTTGETISFTLFPSEAPLTVTLLANPSVIGAVLSGSGTYDLNDNVNISVNPIDGYNFIGWTGSQQDIDLLADASQMATSFTMPNRSVTLTANFEEKIIHTVTFQVSDFFDEPIENAKITVTPSGSKKGVSSKKTMIRNHDTSFTSSSINVPQQHFTSHVAERPIPFDVSTSKVGGEWIHWDDGTYFTTVGLTNGGTFSIASRWEPSDIESHELKFITKISTYINTLPISSTLKIWQGPNANELIEVYSQEFSPNSESWNEIDLIAPYPIDTSQELWFGYEVTHAAGNHPTGIDAITNFDGKGNMIYLNGWESLLDLANINGDWNIQAYVEEPIILYTDENGEASFSALNGEYNFTVEKEEYEIIEDSFVVDNDEALVPVTLLTTYTVSYSVMPSPASGTLTAKVRENTITSGAAVAQGSEIVFTATPDEDSYVKNWWVGIDIQQELGNEFIYSNLQNDIEVAVEFEFITHEVTFGVVGDPPNGTLSAIVGDVSITNGTQVIPGDNIDFTATPVPNFKVKEWRVNNVVQSETGNTFTYENIQEPTYVTVEFEPITHIVSYSVQGTPLNGEITATVGTDAISSGDAIPQGSDIVFTAAPATIFKVKEWKVGDDVQAETSNEFTYSNLQGDISVTVAFEQIMHDVTFSVTGVNGNLKAHVGEVEIFSPDQVAQGSSVVFTAEPASGYRVKEWTLEGEIVVDNISTILMVENLTDPIEVTVEFQEIPAGTFIVNFGVYGQNGTVSAAVGDDPVLNGQSIPEESDILFSATPASNYKVKHWKVNDVIQEGETENQFSYANLQQDINVTVEFEQLTHNVTFSVVGTPPNGTIAATVAGNAIASGDAVAQASDIEFSASPAASYRVKEWKVGGTIQAGEIGNQFTYNDLQGDINVTVEFEQITQTVSFSVAGTSSNGTLTASVDATAITTNDQVVHGSEVVFTASPAADYRMKEWKLNDAVVTSNVTNTYTHSSLSADISVTVEFEPKETPSVTDWPTASEIVYGQALSESTLTGGTVTGSIPGIFAFSTPTAVPDASVYEADVTFTPTDTERYKTASGKVNVTVNQKELTIGGTFTAENKAYDGTKAATIVPTSLTLVGIIGTEVVTHANVTAEFASADVGTGIAVNITDATLAGADAANYTLSLTGAPTATSNITAKELTIGGTFTVEDKVYDNTTAATIASNDLTLITPVDGDDVSLTNVVAEFESEAVGEDKTVSISAAELAGDDLGNYSLSTVGAPTTTATISAVTYTLTLAVSPEETGTVSGAGSYEEGEEVTITATPAEGYVFVKWTITVPEDLEGTEVSTEATTTFTMLAEDVTLTAHFEEDTTEPELFTVTFTVTDTDGKAIADATITIEDEEALTTNADGITSIELENGDYIFTVTKEGYGNYNDNYTVAGEDFVVDVELEVVSVETNLLASLIIYPNPFNNIIKLDNAQGVSKVIIANLIGQKVMEIQLSGAERETLQTDGLIRGVYLITFQAENGERVVRKMIKE